MSDLDKILKKAEKEHDLLKHPYVGTEHLLLAILSEENELTDKLKNYKLTYNKFKKQIKNIIGEGTRKSSYVLYTPMLRKVISLAKENSNNISCIDLFNALLETNEGIAIRIIESMNIDLESINIDETSEDIITNREEEINEILEVLMRKNKCNPLLIGEAGVGKTAIVEELTRRLKKNDVPNALIGYSIVNVDLSSIVAGTKYRGDFELKLNELIKKTLNKKIILFIDEIHTLVNAGGAEGAISASDIIKPYLARGKIKCIGATTSKEYHEFFEKEEALNRRFQTIYIKEPTKEQTLSILSSLKESYEVYHNVKIDDSIFNEIIYVAEKYITNKNNPDKSIELLDTCCTNARFKEEQVVTVNNLYDVFKKKYRLDISNKYIRNILDNKKILLANPILLDSINNPNIIKIDGNNFNNDDSYYFLYGNTNLKNKYLLKRVLDNPVGLLMITNYNYNQILKEFISKIINNRILIDNFGNEINLNNYIIIMEDNLEDKVGFISDNKNEYIFQKIDEKTLLPSL